MTATAQSGVTFGAFRSALTTYGVHVPGGECDDVCIGGYVQGGGYGFTSVSFVTILTAPRLSGGLP